MIMTYIYKYVYIFEFICINIYNFSSTCCLSGGIVILEKLNFYRLEMGFYPVVDHIHMKYIQNKLQSCPT